MNQDYQQNDLFDLKDILFFSLKKYVFAFLFGVVFAIIGFGYKYYSVVQDFDNSDINSVFDTASKLEDETDVDYSKRVQNVNRASDLINSIEVLNNQIENNRKYTSESIYMQIDSENEAITRTNLIVTVDGSQSKSADISLLSTYKQYIMSGDYLYELAEDWGINQSYILDLIRADYVSSSSVVINVSSNTDNVGIVTISVIGSSTEQTDKIMDVILESVDIKCVELNTSMVKHTVVSEGRQSSYIVDNSTRDRQTAITNRFESLQQQIKSCDKALDDVSSALKIKKEKIYAYFSYNDTSNDDIISPVSSAIKFAVLFFVLGVMLVVLVVALNYIFGRKFSTQAKFFTRFSEVNKIGVIKPKNKRSKFNTYIDLKTGDDNYLTYENSIKLLAANINNLISDMSTVMVTGTGDFSKIEELVKELGVNVDVKKSFFVDPTSLTDISNYEGIILFEQRDYSDCKLIEEELRLINNTHAKLIGAVII